MSALNTTSNTDEHDSMLPEFILAVEQNDRRKLMELVSSYHVDPRFVKNDKQETLLHIATKHGLIDIIRTLVEIYQLCPFEGDQFSHTSFHYACRYKHLHILSYFFQIGGHAHISDFQRSHYRNDQIAAVVPPAFELHMLSAAVSSESVSVIRFMYTLLVFNKAQLVFNIKLNLFLDTFYALSKVIGSPSLSYKKLSYINFIASSFKGRCNLSLLQFLLDELAYIHSSSVLDQINEQVRSIYALLFQDAYRLNLDTAIGDYLTKTKGLSPAYEPSTYQIPVTSLQSFNHVHSYEQPYSALHTAILCGNTSTVRALIEPTGVLFRAQCYLFSSKHGTLLHSACVSGSKEMVEMMIQEFEFGRDINVQNSLGNTALHVACEWGWLEIVQYLCECKGCHVNVDVNVVNYYGYSPFTLAIKHNRLEIFKYLLTLNAIDINIQSTDTLETPLHLACCCESPEFSYALLDDARYSIITCNLDTVDKYGDTPLFNAVRIGSIEVVRKLTAKPECNRLYVNDITKETPAHIACRKNRLDILRLILLEGVPKPLKDVQFNFLGKLLLHIACDNDSEEMIDFLIDNVVSTKFDINTTGAVVSPIHIACARENIRIVMKLLKSGICMTADVDKDKNNIFHYICSRELVSPEMVEIFKDTCEMIVKKNKSGKNPLHFIFLNVSNAVQVLHCLSKYINIAYLNAAVCSTDDYGNTPFHIGILQKRFSTVRCLLNTPELADGVSKALCMQNSDSHSPLQMVCSEIWFEYVQLILGSPCVSKKAISEAVCLQDQRNDDNVFHIIIGRVAATQRPFQLQSQKVTIFKILEAVLQCTESDHEQNFVSALCAQNKNHMTPLHYAFNNNSDENLCCIIRLLLKSNLSIKSVETICRAPQTTLIHLAVQRKMFNIGKLLVENQLCDPEMTNSHSQTALHLVCQLEGDTRNKYSGATTYALLLCKHGWDVHSLDKYGHSPASYAFTNNFPLLQELVASGYCKLSQCVQSFQWQKDYCHIMGSSKNLIIQIPLLHLVIYREDLSIHFLITQKKFSPNVCDSFENTIFHLKSFPCTAYPSSLIELCDCDYLNKQNKEGNTPLHIACATGNRSMQNFLIKYEKCSESLFKRNVYGYTPLYYAKDRDMINYLIMNGADPKEVANSANVQHIMKAFEKLKGENPLDPTVTVLVLGNSMAGKTTLIKSLTKAYSWEFIEQPSIGQTKDIHALGEHTAGIEISEYKVFEEDEVRILLYDFAGHPEFQSTHSVLLQNLLTSAQSSEPTGFLFLIVLDITQHDKLAQLMYWAKFIENCESSYAIGRPEVIIIGSHVDRIPEAGSESVHKSVKASLCKTMESASLEFIENPILLDCRDPKLFELQKVKILLLRSTKSLIERADLDIRSHLLFAYLYEHFADKPVRLLVLQKSLKEQMLTGFHVSRLLFTRNTLIDLLKVMHYRQHILLIGLNPSSSEADFWILTAKARSLMFQNVNGLLFASEDFDRHVRIKSNVGILSSKMNFLI